MFNPKEFPIEVSVAWRPGATWQSIVDAGLSAGITDPDELTDLAFIHRHPDRSNRALTRTDIALIAEWKSLRAQVGQRVKSSQTGLRLNSVVASRNGQQRSDRSIPLWLTVCARNDTAASVPQLYDALARNESF